MKVLIIPDIHLDIGFADECITRHGDSCERIVLLGDYFDAEDATLESTLATAQWVRDKLHDPRFTCLLGNHDVQYWFNLKDLNCAGLNEEYRKAIQSVLGEYWHRFGLWTLQDGWLLSHAGVHRCFFREMTLPWEQHLSAIATTALRLAEEEKKVHPFLGCGHARWGVFSVGGVTWCDFAREFKYTKGINQIFGHSKSDRVKKVIVPGSSNYMIDCSQRVCCILEDGVPHFDQIRPAIRAPRQRRYRPL